MKKLKISSILIVLLLSTIAMVTNSNAAVITDENFENGATGWSDNRTEHGGIHFTRFLGRFGWDRSNEVSKDFELSGMQTQVSISFDFFEIDSWDWETFYVYINGNIVVSDQYNYKYFNDPVYADPIPPQDVPWPGDAVWWGTFGFAAHTDQTLRYNLVINTTSTNINVKFATNLGTGVWDESWGIDNLIITDNATSILDGSVGASGGTIVDAEGTGASFSVDPGVLGENINVAIDVILDPGVSPPPGFLAAATRFVSFFLAPNPSPLAPPGATIALPLTFSLPPGTALSLFKYDPNTGSLIDTGVIGTVDLGGSSATFAEVTTFSTFAAFQVANQPPVADAGADQDIYLGETVLLDASNSSDPDGTIASFAWTIDSAPAPSVATLSDPNTTNPNLTPDQAGQYIISLVVNDGTDDSVADTVIVNVTLNLPPVAVATGVPTAGVAPHTVNFDASGSSDPDSVSLSYEWNFGDPTSLFNVSTLENPTHIYKGVGDFIAVVTITDNFGNTDQASVEVAVTAPNMPPTVSPTATVDGFTVQFVANAIDPESNPLTYEWDFGDGTYVPTEINPIHTYNIPGTYTATVTVSDGEFTVHGQTTVSVFSALDVDVFEAKVDSGKKGKVKGKINLKACFSYIGLPLPSEVIKVDFDGINLIEVPFADFEEDVDKPGKFKYKNKNLYMKIDLNKSKLKVSRHNMLLNGLDNSNGMDVFVSFGLSTGSDNIVMKEKHNGHDDHKMKWSYKEKHHHHDCAD